LHRAKVIAPAEVIERMRKTANKKYENNNNWKKKKKLAINESGDYSV
jgi:hypothetical protein